jgi:hypothetical protein
MGPDRLARWPRLPKRRIGDGEVVKERFVGPFAGVVTRRAIGRVGWRAQAACDGGQAQVGEDLPDNRRAFDHGKDLHRPAAAGTEQRIHLIDLADQACGATGERPLRIRDRA